MAEPVKTTLFLIVFGFGKDVNVFFFFSWDVVGSFIDFLGWDNGICSRRFFGRSGLFFSVWVCVELCFTEYSSGFNLRTCLLGCAARKGFLNQDKHFFLHYTLLSIR